MNPLFLLDRGDERLTLKAGRILDIADPGFQAFIDELIRCGKDNLGVGIAAPQVGKSLRLFIMAAQPSPRYPDAPAMEPTAIINPEILRVSDSMETGWEGCLSVPGFRAKVPRHLEVDVAFTDRHGVQRAERFTGFMARLFQHEFDHLEGILYPERLDKGETLITLEEFTALTGIVVPT
ncbi:MAG: polypeptide deformylase [Fibrobacteres bacterium]|nr:polypeptide deformylase [Fibrobacterota bacterium]